MISVPGGHTTIRGILETPVSHAHLLFKPSTVTLGRRRPILLTLVTCLGASFSAAWLVIAGLGRRPRSVSFASLGLQWSLGFVGIPPASLSHGLLLLYISAFFFLVGLSHPRDFSRPFRHFYFSSLSGSVLVFHTRLLGY